MSLPGMPAGAWISPAGEIHSVPFGEHDECAQQLLARWDPDPYSALLARGWIAVLSCSGLIQIARRPGRTALGARRAALQIVADELGCWPPRTVWVGGLTVRTQAEAARALAAPAPAPALDDPHLAQWARAIDGASVPAQGGGA